MLQTVKLWSRLTGKLQQTIAQPTSARALHLLSEVLVLCVYLQSASLWKGQQFIRRLEETTQVLASATLDNLLALLHSPNSLHPRAGKPAMLR